MGCPDDGDYRGSVFAGMNCGQHEHGERNGVYAYQAFYQNHASWRIEDCVGGKEIYFVFAVCNDVFPDNGGCS